MADVYVPPGTIPSSTVANTTYWLSPDMTYTPAGEISVAGGVKIIGLDGGKDRPVIDARAFTSTSLFRQTGNNTHFENLVIYAPGGAYAADAFYSQSSGSSGITIRNCKIIGPYSETFVVIALNAAAYTAGPFIIDRCDIEGFAYTLNMGAVGNAGGCLVRNCKFGYAIGPFAGDEEKHIQTGRAAGILDWAGSFLVEGNEFVHYGEASIDLVKASGVVISNNFFGIDNGRFASSVVIQAGLDGAANNTIIANTIHAREVGISTRGAQELSIIGNEITAKTAVNITAGTISTLGTLILNNRLVSTNSSGSRSVNVADGTGHKIIGNYCAGGNFDISSVVGTSITTENNIYIGTNSILGTHTDNGGHRKAMFEDRSKR